MTIRVQEQPFDLGEEVNAFTDAQDDAGAVVTFTGIVRDLPGGADLDRMVIEHYPGMTEKALGQIAADALSRWELSDVLIIHRYGEMRAGERIMMVAASAKHRKNAFEAAEFLMDYLKSRAPFWKKEHTTDGGDWVAARDEDEDALKRW